MKIRTGWLGRGVLVAALASAVIAADTTPVIHAADGVFISELHYDNAGTDAGEAVEVTGPAGVDLAGWSIVFYNGNGGAAYGTLPLTGVLTDVGDGIGAAAFDFAGIQNGDPDGLALVDDTGALVEFLSYEGTFTAVGGPADGLSSIDIGVAEPGTTPIGESLQKVGDSWTGPAASSFGTPNGAPPAPPALAISELHYDNAGTDAGEAVEVTGPAGVDLAGWSIVFYNGNGGAVYKTVALSGVVPDETGGFGAVAVAAADMQNGSPDGLALVDPDGAVVDALSYEGAFVAVDGTVLDDIGVAEGTDTPVGHSLQLIDGVWTGPAANTFGLLNVAPVVVGACPDLPEITPIHQVQGSGADSPCAGETVAIEGVVVGDYEGASPALRGFYVQSADTAVDADPATSEGIFVFNGGADEVSVGQTVHVEGTVAEFQGQTQLATATTTVVAPGGAASPVAVSLPVASPDTFESVEGMLVTFEQELFVTELFHMSRSGEIRVSSGDRLAQPTAVVEPGPDAVALQAQNNLNVLIIDDTTNAQNPEPYIFGPGGTEITADNPLRGGDSTTGATGVMTYTWGGFTTSTNGNAYRLRPAAEPIVFDARNPRPGGPPEVGGSLKIVGFNVLNYFLTLDDGGDDCGPVASRQECRGAETAEEYERQHDKLIAALTDIDADVYGFAELENSEGVDPLAPIVADLNAAAGAAVWSAVDTGIVGTDTIRVGMIYRNDAVAVVGTPAVLDSSVDPLFDDDLNRPSLAVTIEELDGGGRMTVALNHWKSKGSCPGDGSANDDAGDGAGCWNATRADAATALVNWLGTHPTGVVDDDVLVFGDLNSYAMEDPIDVLRTAGYVDEVQRFTPGAYSYVFDGQWGTLDYAFASASLDAQITGAADYHINADEPPVLDYNTNFKSPTQIDELYAPDRFRTSDHDPALVGVALDPVAPPTADCAVEYIVHGVWPGGFNTQIWLTNTGTEPINGWELGWTFTAGESINHGWSGVYASDGADVTVSNLPWNATIRPGKRITFGFIGQRDGAALPQIPAEFTLDGAVCTG